MQSLRSALAGTEPPRPAEALPVDSQSAFPPWPGTGQPGCPGCHGLGYVRDDHPIGHPDFGKVYPCACRLSELEAARPASELALLGLIPPVEKTFENFEPAGRRGLPAQKASLRLAYDIAKRYAEAPHGWLLMQGSSGVGKTHLAAAIANTRLASGETIVFASASGLLDRLRNTFDPLAWESYDRVFAQIRDCPLLVIDDLGDESPTPWALEKLYQLFNHRSLAALPTVITTRLPLERIEGRIRSRSLDIDLVRKLQLDAPDYWGDSDALSRLSDLAQYARQTFETFDLRDGESHLTPLALKELRIAYNCARNFAFDPHGWLVLAGGRANGKTHLAAAIGNHCQAQSWPCIFLTAAVLLKHLREAFDPNSPALYDEVYAELKSTPILILDDLRFSQTSPWARAKLAQLLDSRHLAQLPTVVTTPHKPEDLGARFEVRLLDPQLSVVCPLSTPAYKGIAYRSKRERR